MQEMSEEGFKSMNIECNGDYFTADGQDYYRCLWDGKVLAVADYPEFCLNCNRRVEAHDLGELEAETITIHRVTFPNGWEIILPEAEAIKV